MKFETKLILVQVGGSAAAAGAGYLLAPTLQPFINGIIPMQASTSKVVFAVAAGGAFYVLVSASAGFLRLVGLDKQQ